MREKRGFDCDDVLFPTGKFYFAWLNDRLGKNVEMGDVIHYRFWEFWGVSKQDFSDLFLEFDKTETKKNISPTPGAQTFVRRLAECYQLEIVTARPPTTRDQTYVQLEKHFPGCFSKVHFSITTDRKWLICKDNHIPVLFEDHPKAVVSCSEAGIHVFVHGQPWNQEEFPLMAGAVIRFHSYQDQVLQNLF